MYAQYFMHGYCYRSRNLSSVYCTLTNQLVEQKVCTNWNPHMLNDDQTAMCVLATTYLQHWRNESIHSFIVF